MRDGVKWSDGEALTADDVAYTYNRVLTATIEGTNWSSYLPASPGHRAGRHDGGAEAEEAERGAAAAADPDRARARLEERQREADQELRRRAEATASRSSAPARSGSSGHGGRVDVRVRGEPGLLGRRAAHRRGRLPGLQERRPGRAGPDQGRGRLRRGHHAAPGQGAPGQARDHRAQRRLSRLRRDRASTPARSTSKTDKPIGDGNPALQDPKFRHALGYAVDLDRDRRERLPGRRRGRPRRSCRRRTRSWHWEPPGDEQVHLRPRQGRPAAGRGRLQEGLRRQAHACPTASRSARCGCSPAATRRRRSTP